jgi:hypothetical protein
VGNALRFRPARPVTLPFLWLTGEFRLASESPYTDGPRHTLKTEGPFALEAGRQTLAHDLVADGFPFLRRPLIAEAEVVFANRAPGVRLDGWIADAMRLSVDGHAGGWSWEPDGVYRFAEPVQAGTHTLKIELIPNTFNACGPHHHYAGDPFVVSPAQIAGARNFADPVDAPERTHVTAWHFRRLQLPRAFSLLDEV